jgi:hypothetical protein
VKTRSSPVCVVRRRVFEQENITSGKKARCMHLPREWALGREAVGLVGWQGHLLPRAPQPYRPEGEERAGIRKRAAAVPAAGTRRCGAGSLAATTWVSVIAKCFGSRLMHLAGRRFGQGGWILRFVFTK